MSDKTKHSEHLSKGTFLMVCSGESYFTSVVKGPDIVRRMMAAMCGEDEKHWPDGEKDFWLEHISDPDNWTHDMDYGPTRFNLDVGETDHIELFLLTHL